MLITIDTNLTQTCGGLERAECCFVATVSSRIRDVANILSHLIM